MTNITSYKPPYRDKRRVWRQTWMIMRLATFLIIISTLSISAKSYSQKINLSLKDSPVTTAFSLIRQQSGYSFLWTEKTMEGLPSVNVSVHEASLKEALEACLQGLPLTYNIHGNVVYIERKLVPVMQINPEAALPAPPSHEVTGSVKDSATGVALAGVTIQVKGTTIGTTTDITGNFNLSVPNNNAVLIVSFLGYTQKEISVRERNVINIILTPATTGLNQLVVVGYSTQQKKDLTGAVSVVDMKDLKNKPVAGVGEMLKGEVPGLTVNNDYSPGGGVAIRIRGFSTIDNNNPLYIIDGVPSTGGLNTINPNDIASIQVLKDAASASIYGSRAANGVIIITTKQGETGKPKISFNGYTGVQEAFHLPQMLSAQQYGDMLWEAMKNDGITPSNDVYGSGSTPVIPKWLDANKTVPSGNVNWIKELFHPAVTQSYNLSISNGTKDAHQYFSLGYLDQDGTMKYTGFKRITAMMNTDGTFFDRLKIGENFTASYTTTTAITNNSVNSGVLYDAVKFPSISPVYDINGNYAGSPLNDAWNPLGALYRNRNNRMKDVNLFGNVFADLLVVKGLHLKTNIGLNYATTNFRDYSPKYVELGTLQSQSTLATSNEYSYNVVWSNTAEYKKTLGKNNFDLLGGMETVKNYEEDFSGSRIGFPFDAPNFQYLDAGSGSAQTNTGTGSQWSLLSFFGNLTYNYDQRYLLSATVRRDGSSKLGNNKWGNFPAISAGWNIAQESFFNIKFIDQLKIRASWGKNGNQDIPTYSTIDGYISDPNNSNYSINGVYNSTTTGYIQSRVANPDLRWETTTQIDYGLDFGLFNSSLQGSVDYFNKNTTDMLVQLPLPPVMGGTNQTTWVNGGSMNNKGIEIQLTYRHTLNNNLSFTVGGNIASYKNKLTSLPTGVPYIGISTATLHGTNFDQEVARTYVGDPLGSFYGYKVLGLFQDEQQIVKYGMEPNAHPGDFIFADVNKDGVIDDKDRTFIGAPLPKFTYGFNASVSWEHFDLSLFIQGSYGNKIYDLTRYYGGFFDLSDYNKFNWVEDAWTSSNTHTSIPRLSVLDPNNNIRPSSYYVQPGSYARLKNIQLGYNLPEKVVHGDLRLYIMAENLLTITRYSGMNPEVGFQNYNSDNESLDNGVDRGLYPPSKMFIVGVNMTF